ncbi:hypothetical protein C1646_781132 [Rhizophagus diaphanus]|nr:hypothetical protein C1646_781132 [Rhizophagus diaphanus] [Rhizophagus sp. MUCL 43196]
MIHIIFQFITQASIKPEASAGSNKLQLSFNSTLFIKDPKLKVHKKKYWKRRSSCMLIYFKSIKSKMTGCHVSK